jgi:hypothetical protein
MRARAALLIIPLLLALLVAPAVGSPDAEPDASSAPPSQAPVLQSEEPGTEHVLRINITNDGDAEWTVTTRIHGLDNESERQAFRDLAQEVKSGQTDVGHSVRTFERFAADASAATGRDMSIQDERWSSEIRDETGYISFTLTWTNFVRIEGDRLLLGDVFQTESGTWLSQLDDNQQLVINAPPGYAVDSLNFQTPPDEGVDSGTVRWSGPLTFEEQDIQMTFVPTGASSGTGTETGTDSGGTDGPPTGILGTLVAGGGGLLAAIGLLVAGAHALRTRRDRVVAALQGVVRSDEDEQPAMVAGDDPATAPAGQIPAEGTADSSGGDEQAATESQDREDESGDDGSDGDRGTAAPPADDVDPELLSDEERIERMLRQNGGRMKQATIVTETGWSNAKVSQLLSSMDEADRVDKLRIGRENLISLPDEDVTDVE